MMTKTKNGKAILYKALALILCIAMLSGIWGIQKIVSATEEPVVKGWTKTGTTNFEFTEDNGNARFKETKPSFDDTSIDVISNKIGYSVENTVEFDLFLNSIPTAPGDDFWIGLFLCENYTSTKLTVNEHSGGTLHFQFQPYDKNGIRLEGRCRVGTTTVNSVGDENWTANVPSAIDKKVTLKFEFMTDCVNIYQNSVLIWKATQMNKSSFANGKVFFNSRLHIGAGTGLFDLSYSEVRYPASFDNNAKADVVIKEAGVTSIEGNDIKATDYTISGDVVTFKKEYLQTLSNGLKSFRIKGADFDKKVNIEVSNRSIKVTGISFAKTEGAYAVGDEFKLEPILTPANADNKEIKYTTSDEKVAKIENGKVIMLKVGTATITATTTDGNFKATIKVTVMVKATSIKLDKTSLTLDVGKTDKVIATINPTDATNKDLTYTSSDSAVASVDATGKITAVKKGTATITVKNSEGVEAKCVVTVNEAKKGCGSLVLPTSFGGISGGLMIILSGALLLGLSKKKAKQN